MVRVLHELSALDGGGVAKLLFDYYSNMNKEKVHFDFLIYDYYDEGIYEKPLREMGCTIHKIPRIKKSKKGYLQGMKNVIANGNYDVVHSHMGARGLFVMYFAQRYGVKKRIAHSHIAYEPVTGMKRCLNKMLSVVTKFFATDLFACGQDAGLYMWGKKCSEKGKIRIMTNAVDTSSFTFSPEIREAKRKELGVEDKTVIGIVGRLSSQKNYPFLFRVYKKLLETNSNVILVVVGRGIEEEEIKRQAKQLDIDKQILFLGVRNDVPELLNAFDLFVLPSLYEGLPVVLIEAQANGLRQIVSDKITKEMDITDLIHFLPIENSEEQWVDSINQSENNVMYRAKYSREVAQAGYDIKVESKKMEQFYLL